jgi:hypothetical protein
MTSLQDMPVIAEMNNIDISDGRSRFAIFLDGDATNTAKENIMDEEYFDNCYSFDQFMEDFLVIDWLTLERENLKAELQIAQKIITQLQSEQGNK